MNKGIRIRAFVSALFLLFNSFCCFCTLADNDDDYYSEKEILVVFDDKLLTFDTNPVIAHGRTLVPMRTMLESFGCEVVWDEEASTVKAVEKDITLEIQIGKPWVTGYTQNEIMTYQLDVPAMIINDRTYLPLRKIAEIFHMTVLWEDETQTVYLSKNPTREFLSKTHTYYFQNDERWMLPGYGSGYCWVCSYAMVINDIVGNVTPSDIKAVNEKYMENGALCYHYFIAQEYGLEFVNAIDEASPYFERFDFDYGATYINNPDKSDEIIYEVLREALKKHPEGVMVRFEKYPHTMVAVGYADGEILFNEPANGWGTYTQKGTTEAVTFDKTYPCRMGLRLSDMEYIQALDVNN